MVGKRCQCQPRGRGARQPSIRSSPQGGADSYQSPNAEQPWPLRPPRSSHPTIHPRSQPKSSQRYRITAHVALDPRDCGPERDHPQISNVAGKIKEARPSWRRPPGGVVHAVRPRCETGPSNHTAAQDRGRNSRYPLRCRLLPSPMKSGANACGAARARPAREERHDNPRRVPTLPSPLKSDRQYGPHRCNGRHDAEKPDRKRRHRRGVDAVGDLDCICVRGIVEGGRRASSMYRR
jgi:hypothetical protein